MTDFTPPPLRATHHCRHYSYNLPITRDDAGPQCAVGCDMSPAGAALKCMPEPRGETCPLREEYTEAERAEYAAWRDERIIRLSMACCALPVDIKVNTSGKVDCPNCGGIISYARWKGGAELHCNTPHCCAARFSVPAENIWPSNKVGERAK